MPQRRISQDGTFHITVVTQHRIPWCMLLGIPQILIDNLCMTRTLYRAELFAFCILPDHMHLMVRPGEKGLSAFMHSFKRNSSRDVGLFLKRPGNEPGLRSDFNGWQPRFYGEIIRDGNQRSSALAYIQHNAFRHGLVKTLEEWPWTSLHFADRLDPLDLRLD